MTTLIFTGYLAALAVGVFLGSRRPERPLPVERRPPADATGHWKKVTSTPIPRVR